MRIILEVSLEWIPEVESILKARRALGLIKHGTAYRAYEFTEVSTTENEWTPQGGGMHEATVDMQYVLNLYEVMSNDITAYPFREPGANYQGGTIIQGATKEDVDALKVAFLVAKLAEDEDDD